MNSYISYNYHSGPTLSLVFLNRKGESSLALTPSQERGNLPYNTLRQANQWANHSGVGYVYIRQEYRLVLSAFITLKTIIVDALSKQCGYHKNIVNQAGECWEERGG